MTFKLPPPPPSKDSRFDQWVTLMWKYLTGITVTSIGAQPVNANLTSISALSNAAGYLHNDGAGVFAYSNPTAVVAPGLMAFLAAHG